MALVATITEQVPDLSKRRAHIVSTAGPFFDWLQKGSGELWCSQYFDGVPGGATVDGVRCEDLQRLTYEDSTFDLVTSSEVLEHVPDDHAAFCEMRRVLKPGGALIFTVPMSLDGQATVERARLTEDGSIRHLLTPEYHDDPIRGRILAYRNYGLDILDRLRASGYVHAEIVTKPSPTGLTCSRPVVVAHVGASRD